MRICILTVVSVLLLTGCGHVTKKQLAWAEDVCRSNGGIRYYDYNFESSDAVMCKNGAEFEAGYLRNGKIPKVMEGE